MIKSELTSKEISKTLTLEAVGYRFTGTACVIDWYDNSGSIKMKPFNIYFSEFNTHEEFMTLLKERLNDNGYGVQDIRGALVDEFMIYSDPNDKYAPEYKVPIDYGIVVNADDDKPMYDDEINMMYETIFGIDPDNYDD